MSVLIKGMETPVIELDWTIRRGADGKWYAIDTNAETSDGEWHEIIPVPPHGDLIDRDALTFSRIRIAHPGGIIGGYNAVVMSAEINNAPTIIPAEEGGE